MNRNKTIGPDGIVIAILADLDNLCIDKIAEIINKIYNIGDVPEALIRFIVELLKNPGANQCKLQWIISLMSDITKLIIQIRMSKRIEKL